ncbi:hypothetical protein BC830DRAFT_1098282 [Chytriomyces sp. MP71]|nr:hypothetical protein BC830DRAFT_1098282 [Chytriomyces sp. MP71]
MAGSQRHVNRRRDPQAPHPSECNFSINKRVSGVWRVSRGTAKCNFKPHSRLDAMQRSELLPNPSQASSDAVLDDVSQETLREMAFRKRWTSLMERLQSESASGSEWTIVTAALQGRRFDESAEVLARLVLKGDPDACWVLCADPRDSPVGDPFFR